MEYPGKAVLFLGLSLIYAVGWLRGDDTNPAPLISTDGHKIVTLDESNNVFGLPVMTFYVRYPAGMSPKDKVNGVFADVIWLKQKKDLLAWIERPSKADINLQFADQHKLAVVTWTTATMYSIDDSFTADPNDLMEVCFRTWKAGMDKLCQDYSLPTSGYLIFGTSRGAQWAHRIVLRSPEKFLAVHIHINSSYAEPTPEAAHCLWLVTTGELEYGNAAAREFFHKGLALGYPILLRIYPGKGHEGFSEEERLGVKFFDYALQLRARQQAASSTQSANPPPTGEDQPFALDDSLLAAFRNPPYYGDLLNGDVYPSSQKALLPELERVAIPTQDIAETWGYFHP